MVRPDQVASTATLIVQQNDASTSSSEHDTLTTAPPCRAIRVSSWHSSSVAISRSKGRQGSLSFAHWFVNRKYFMRLRIASGFNKRLHYGHTVYDGRTMTAIPVNSQFGQIIGLEVKPASDNSGDYVLVVRLDNSSIDVGSVDVSAVYKLTPPVLNVGDNSPLLSDVSGNLKVSIAAIDQDLPPRAVYQTPTASSSFALIPGSSAALEAAHVIKSSPGNLYSLYAITTSVGGYLMTFDATTPPADGPVDPMECVAVPPHGVVALSTDGGPPDHYRNGIVAVFSSTGPFVKTASSTAFFKWSVQ